MTRSAITLNLRLRLCKFNLNFNTAHVEQATGKGSKISLNRSSKLVYGRWLCVRHISIHPFDKTVYKAYYFIILYTYESIYLFTLYYYRYFQTQPYCQNLVQFLSLLHSSLSSISLSTVTFSTTFFSGQYFASFCLKKKKLLHNLFTVVTLKRHIDRIRVWHLV